jgi:hypothetical protein
MGETNQHGSAFCDGRIASTLLAMPDDILFHIFYQMPTAKEAVKFAGTCSRLYRLFEEGRNKTIILKMSEGIPREPPGYDIVREFRRMRLQRP